MTSPQRHLTPVVIYWLAGALAAWGIGYGIVEGCKYVVARVMESL